MTLARCVLTFLSEYSPKETYDAFNVNVFGILNVTRAVLPYMRAQKSGVIAHFGSVGSWGGAPAGGIYCGTKWVRSLLMTLPETLREQHIQYWIRETRVLTQEQAISGVTEALYAELSPFGINACIIEPGYFRTGFLNPGARLFTEARLDEYENSAVGQVRAMFEERNNKQAGDVEKGCRVIFEVLTKKDGKEIPMRLALGTDAYEAIGRKCDSTKALMEKWKDVIVSTDHDVKYY